jgi:hypothetical protein
MRPLLFFFIGWFCHNRRRRRSDGGARRDFGGRFTALFFILQRMIWYLIALGYVVNLNQRGTASLNALTHLETEPDD